MRFGTTDHALTKPVLDHSLGDLRIRAIESVERARSKFEVKLCSVRSQSGARAVEDLYGSAAGIVLSLHHEGRNGTNENRLGNTALRLAVSGNITGDFATTGGMADVNRVLQIKMLTHGRGVRRVVVHVVAFADLTRAPVAAPVVGNNAVTLAEEI